MRTFKLYLAFLAIIFTTNVNAGSFDWARQYMHTTLGETPRQVKTDHLNNIIVGGQTFNGGGSYAGFIMKYDSAGILLFNKAIYGQNYSEVTSIGLNYTGDIYFTAPIYDQTGNFGSVVLTNPDPNLAWTALVKLNSSGTLLWYKVIDYSTNVKIAVDSIGNVFAATGDSLMGFSSSGSLNWTTAINGNILDVDATALILSSATKINMINKSNGSLLTSVNVSNCLDAVIGNTNEVYYTGNAGTVKMVNLIPSWNNTNLAYSKIDFNSTGLWLGKTLFDNNTYIDTTLITKVASNGTVLSNDSLLNTVLLTFNINSIGKLIVLGTWTYNPNNGNYLNPAVFKPFQISNDLSFGIGGGGYVMGTFNSNASVSLGFASIFWDVNDDYAGYWRNGNKQCPGGSPFNVSYRIYDGTFQPGSVVFAELSDVNGQFVNPTVIGANSPAGVTGVISCQLPSSLVASNQYVIRLRATGPSITSLQVSHSLGIASPISTISLSGNSPTFCSKTEKFTVTSSSSNDTYSWQRNGVDLSSSSTIYSPTSSGTYRCITTDTWGCSKLSNNQIAVTVKALPNAAINYSGNKEICNSDTLQLAVPLVAGNSYQWYKGVAAISGQTSNAYITNITGNYKVTVTGSNGCSKSSSVLKLSVYKPSIQAFGPTTFCNGGNVVLGISSGTTNSWQWMKNNVNISGANNQYYVSTKTGYYKAATTNSNGCTGVSANIVVTVNCREGEIENEFNTKLQAYPNPINDRVTIEGASISSNGKLTLYDLTGRELPFHIESIEDGIAIINCSMLNEGVFILKYKDGIAPARAIKLSKR